MKKISLILLIPIFVCFGNHSSGQDMDEILEIIAGNNPYLIAEKKHTETKSLEYRTGLVPSNPRVSYGYFPGNKAAPGTKTTLDIMQSFDFPTTYMHRKNLAGDQIEKTLLREKSVRQEILFQAKLVLVELIYLHKMNQELTFRLAMAEKLNTDFEKKLTEGSGNIVEMNRANLEFVSATNRLMLNETAIRQRLENLYQMNGGDSILINQLFYSSETLVPLDSLTASSLDNIASIKMLDSDKKIARDNVKLQKSNILPSFEVGYGSEMVADQAFRGGRVGISIPLWEDKNRIKTARAYADYTQLIEESVINEHKSILKQDYLLAQSLKSNLEELLTLITTLRDHEILKRSLESGQISSIEYFVEVAYYYELMDQYLEMEKDYQVILAKLYKYKL